MLQKFNAESIAQQSALQILLVLYLGRLESTSVILNDFLTDESKHFGRKQGQAAEISFYFCLIFHLRLKKS